jgi:hypothetical protein
MFDITMEDGLWNAVDIANVKAGRATFGTAPNTATLDNQPMISRSADGTKVFFAWCDNSTYTAGAANTLPNIFSCGYNVVTKNWTTISDFTSCNGATAGSMFFPKLAAEMLEPASGTYKLPVVATTMTSSDPILAASFRFIDNMTWTNADFTIAQPVATVSINEGATWLLCPGSTLGLSITGSYNQALWSDNTTNLTTTINAPGTYYVTARSGCTIGRDSIVVTGQMLTVSASAATICAGDPVTLTAAGNSLGYSWSPVVSTSNQVSDVPALPNSRQALFPFIRIPSAHSFPLPRGPLRRQLSKCIPSSVKKWGHNRSPAEPSSSKPFPGRQAYTWLPFIQPGVNKAQSW